jgi:hypothetical protein
MINWPLQIPLNVVIALRYLNLTQFDLFHDYDCPRFGSPLSPYTVQQFIEAKNAFLYIPTFDMFQIFFFAFFEGNTPS